MNFEDRSAAYTQVCEQRTTENHGFIPREVGVRTRPSNNSFFPYLGRISGTGSVVTGMTIVGGDGMLPIYGNRDHLAYIDLMGDYASDATYLISPGGGYRTVNNNQIFGGYFFGDNERTSSNAHFWVLSPGVEWMSPHWDIHVNGYFPTETEKQSGDSYFLSDTGDNSQVSFQENTHNQYDEQFTPYSIIGNGIDAEVGFSFGEFKGLRSRVYLGGYYYYPPSSDNVDDITGITGGFEQAISNNIKVSLFNSYDQINHYVTGIGLTLTFDQDSMRFSNNVQDRLLDSVERHIGLIDTGAGTYDQDFVSTNYNVLQYSNVYFMEGTPGGYDTELTGIESNNDGTYGNPMELTQSSLDTINSESPSGARIYLQGGDVYYVNADTAGDPVSVNSTNYYGLEVYDNQDFYGRAPNNYAAPASEDEQPIILADSANNYNAFIIVDTQENTFSDLSISAYSNSESANQTAGIVAFNTTNDDLTLTIDDTNIYGMDSFGVYAENDGSGTFTLTTADSTFNDNGVLSSDETGEDSAGIFIVNNATGHNNAGKFVLDMTNSELNGNGVTNGTGGLYNHFVAGLVIANGNGTVETTVSNTQFNGNGVVNAINSTVNGNASGVIIVNDSGNSTFQATNSTFNNNGSALGDNSSVDAAGILAENNAGDLLIDVMNSQFNNNGVASGVNSYIDGNAAGIDAENNTTGTLTIKAKNSQFNGNAVASGSNSYITGYSAGIYATNESSGTINLTATNSQFIGNGIGTLSLGYGAGLSVNNAGSSTGTLSVLDLSGSSLNNNGSYGIYGLGTPVSLTTIDDSNATFSGNTSTNQSEGDNINWVDTP